MHVYCVVIAGSILWCFPFVRAFARSKRSPLQTDRRARWGVALQAVGYSILWQGSFWLRTPSWWSLAISAVFFLIAIALSRSAAQVLALQLRVDAVVDTRHQLVTSGPFRFIRHPIYASMLCVLLGTGIVISSLLLSIIAILVFLIGSEIRMRIEDRLLASCFGTQFEAYEQSVPRLIPFF